MSNGDLQYTQDGVSVQWKYQPSEGKLDFTRRQLGRLEGQGSELN